MLVEKSKTYSRGLIKMPKFGGGKKSGKGSHGSLNKAGKVRASTPKIEPTPKRTKGTHPRCRNRKRYVKEFLRPEPFTLTPKKGSRYKR